MNETHSKDKAPFCNNLLYIMLSAIYLRIGSKERVKILRIVFIAVKISQLKDSCFANLKIQKSSAYAQ